MTVMNPDVVPAADRTRSRGAVLATMCAGMFLVLLDVTVVNVALPSIGSGLGITLAGMQWVVAGYGLSLSSMLLAGGTLGDRFGHRRIVLLGLGVFGVASLGCGLAPDVGVLVAARIAQGVGAALLLPGTLAVVSRTFPGRVEQARAIGVWAAISSLALPAGPVVGGLLVSCLGWRSVFLINLPVVAAAMIATALLVRPTRTQGASTLNIQGWRWPRCCSRRWPSRSPAFRPHPLLRYLRWLGS